MTQQGSGREKRLIRLKNVTEKPISYSEFVRHVRQFKTQRLLRMLADVGRQQWLSAGKLSDGNHPIYPHAASLVALEAMGGWGRPRQIASTVDDLRYLNNLVIGLEDPFIDSAGGQGAAESLDDYALRVAFQQFPY